MSFRTTLGLVLVGFCLLCGWLVVDGDSFRSGPAVSGEAETPRPRGLLLLQQTVDVETEPAVQAPAVAAPQIQAATTEYFDAVGGAATTVTIGSVDPTAGFMFQLELDPKGAAIRQATFSKFNDRDTKNPQPLVFLSPVRLPDGREILSMANKGLVLVAQQQQLPLDQLSWKALERQTAADGSEAVAFEATIVDSRNADVLRLTKTYRVRPGTYLLDCTLQIENLRDTGQKVRYNLAGPVGLEREAFRQDMRKLVAGFQGPEGKISTARLDKKALNKAETASQRQFAPKKAGGRFLWAAAVNKYFAAIVVPVPDANETFASWMPGRGGVLYNPDGDAKANSDDESIGLNFSTATAELDPAGTPNSTRTYNFQLYLGPKDKSLFDRSQVLLTDLSPAFQSDLDRAVISPSLRAQLGNSRAALSQEAYVTVEEQGKEWLLVDSAETYVVKNEQGRLNVYGKLYHQLGFVNTIDFMACCCPASIISPLAFGILAIMKAMYAVIGNYGIVIIILVFLMRLVMHPITKKSQISMSKMSKLAPRAEEIKKKYAGNKTEMNKKMMELYREQGASPITGMLPMFVQMPIWIALWSAVYTSIDLRGAPFLPFWITDLSVPDALVRFSTVTVPLLGWKIESLNVLPLLMGVAFYLQQKLMPSQANASTNPQMAQQQKMMMIMMPLMFPLMLYKAPSGVNLYIMASTFAGVIEQYVIRKHIREKDELEAKGMVAVTSKTGGKVKKKKPKPFFRT